VETDAQFDHLAIAVKDLDAAAEVYSSLLGVPVHDRERVEDQGVDVVFLGGGPTHIELICPFDEGNGVSKFLERRGEGLHHICISVADLPATLAALRSRGVPLIDEQPRRGAGGESIAFVHPRGGRGVLIELKQRR
jgi:methylmalonyl-CoA/ethylmalonyl-CoA epimerase